MHPTSSIESPCITNTFTAPTARDGKGFACLDVAGSQPGGHMVLLRCNYAAREGLWRGQGRTDIWRHHRPHTSSGCDVPGSRRSG